MKTLICVLIVALFSSGALAEKKSKKRLHKEKWYQEKWCSGKGVGEFTLPDRTRIDCLTKTHAIEIDFADKWYEAIGQALHYSLESEKRAGILLIVEKFQDRKHYIRMINTIKWYNLPIDDCTKVNCALPKDEGGE